MSNKTKIFIGVVILLGIIGLLLSLKGCFNSSTRKQQDDIIHQADLAQFAKEKSLFADSLEKCHQDTIKLIAKKQDSSNKSKDAEIATIKRQSAQKDIALAELSIKANFGGNAAIHYDTITKQVTTDTNFVKDYNVMSEEYEKSKEDLNYETSKFDECQESNASCDSSKSALHQEIAANKAIQKDQAKIINNLQHNSFISKIFSWSKNAIIVVAVGVIVVSNHLIR